jgi:hypothetical protein
VAPFAEAVEVVRAAGIETGTFPIALDYEEPPPVIADWVARVHKRDEETCFQAPMHMVLDDETLETAAGISGIHEATIPVGGAR